jgi:hypothetical protein
VTISRRMRALDCFVARAPRNDEESARDEPNSSLRAKRSNPVFLT